jgi:nitrogen fixation NifU-like protein
MAKSFYSKEVIKHFNSPHNYGKIKNYDGLGKVGNMICLLPTEKINLANEIKPLKDLKVGDFVLSHTGIINKVEQTSCRKYKGKIIELKNKLGSLSLTPEHLIYAIKVPKGNKYLRTKYRKLLSPAWYHSTHLEQGDIVLYPITKKIEKTEFLEINIPKAKYDFKSIEIPSKIKVDAGILRLFGYFLSEGNITERKCSNFITFTLNIKEDDIAEDIKKIVKKIGLSVVIRKKPEHNSMTVNLYSVKLAKYFKNIFGNYADKKSIPEFLMVLPPNMQKHLLYGMWKGDGYINLDRDGARAEYSTISYMISQQVKILLLRQGIIPSIYFEKEKTTKGVHHKENYRVHVGQRESLKRLCKIMHVEYYQRTIVHENSWIDKKYLYTPIRNINNYDYDGRVCNLEVDKAHSFTTESFCVHNCGDEMWLYIKIAEKDKKEIIKDVKFETFGCVAAIATSSVVTDLIMGKTIAQALKVKKEDIVKVLGELPPIKLHCSVLAIDALSEAVYDYYSKKKVKIPKDVEERHQIIMKRESLHDHEHEDN